MQPAVVLIPNWEQLGIGNFGDKLGASWELGIGSARSLGIGWEPGSQKKISRESQEPKM